MWIEKSERKNLKIVGNNRKTPPLIAVTRITVELILEKLGAGESIDDLLLDYPQLTHESVLAALRFALHVMRNKVVYPGRGHGA